MKNIGSSINEAIDWTQDRLSTTRPLAERTLFSLLESEIVEETDEGFVLVEAEEEAEKHHTKVKNNFTKNWQRYRFHAKRKNSKKMTFHDKRQQQQRNLDQDDSDSTDPVSSDSDPCDKEKHIEIS